MSDKIKITCPRCKHKWEQPLKELEVIVEGYRGDKKEENSKRNSKVSRYMSR